MSLSIEHIPFTKSLRGRVVEEFSTGRTSPPRPLLRSEIISFLARTKESDASPLETIRRRAAQAGRSADFAPEDFAILKWVCKAFAAWEERYPLEGPLHDQVHRLLPLAAAMALRDEDFFRPGAHSLHQLLDALQAGAVGWQMRLDRAGQMLQQRVERSVERALESFQDPNTDIAAITRELVAANERDSARAQRMVQRLAETEQARLRTLTARRQAALFINRGLTQFELPTAIGDFLKGPWFDSAQLVLVRHGPDSEEWSQLRRATHHLMESVQDRGRSDESQRDRIKQMLRRLPGELRRWLWSLEHDSDAVESAMGLVEYAHLRLQHGQHVPRTRITPLPVEDEPESPASHDDTASRMGEWYCFEDDDGELRAQLVLELDNGSQLLFTNFVGLKAIDLSRRSFLQRLEDGFAGHLPNAASFSLSLADALGIDSEESYQRFVDPAYRTTPAGTPPPVTSDGAAASRTPLFPDREPSADSRDERLDAGRAAESTPMQVAADDADIEFEVEVTRTPAADDDEPEHAFDPVLTPPEGAETEFTLDLDPEPQANVQDPPSVQPQAPRPGPAPYPGPGPTPPVSPTAREFPRPERPEAVPLERAAPEPPSRPAPPQAPSSPSPAPAPADPPAPPAPDPFAEGPEPSRHSVEAAETPTSRAVTPEPVEPPRTAPETPAWRAPGADAPGPASAAAPPRPAPPGPSAAPIPPQAPPPPPVAPSQAAPPPPAAAPVAPREPPPAAPPSRPAAPLTEAPSPAPAPASATREVDVPMGAWLGFHDGETPIMAKLAVFDPRRDNYIFVNRKGIALRELNRAELLQLMDRGLVDILETRSYFREEVERARGAES